jgi:type II secretory pathway component PulM
MKTLIGRAKARIEDIGDAYRRLSTRERVAVAVLGGVVVLLVFLAMTWLLVSEIEQLEERNEAIQQALRDLERYKEPFLTNKEKQDALSRRVGTTPLELNSYVERVASNVGIKISESRELKAVSSGRYARRSLEIKLRKVSIEQLVRMLAKLDATRTHLVQVTEMSVKARWNRHEELDVELVVSTYDVAKGKPSPRRSKRAGRSSYDSAWGERG